MQLTQGLKRAVQANGEGIAVEGDGYGRTWLQTIDRIQRLAAGLKILGLQDGERVAILSLNSVQYYEMLFAVAWAGGVFVPVNSRLAGPEVVHWLNDSEARILCVDGNFLELWRGIADQVPSVERLVHMADGDAPEDMSRHESLIAGNPPIPDADKGGDDLAGIFYTGGTTGRSKGVMLSHRNLVANAMQVLYSLGIDRHSSWLHVAPMFHQADALGTFSLTIAGGRHCFVPGFTPDGALEAMQRFRISHAIYVPTMLNMIVNHPDVGNYDLSAVKTIMYGASPMPETVVRRALELMPTVAFVHGYGQTESAPILTMLPSEFIAGTSASLGKINSIGLSAMMVDLKILDEDGNEVAPGSVGEICARGPNVMLGYWRQPELTAETLRDGWLHTGDGGYMDEDGFFYIVDRIKDMIITGAENVFSAEVENALYQHDAVLECAVIGVPDDKWGERVHAIVRLKPATAASEEELVARCRELIAGYKVPRSLEFRTDPLPLSGAGKILKTELRAPYWEGRERQVS